MSLVIPFFWIVGSALAYWLTGYLLSGFSIYTPLIEIIWVAILFGFGMTLSMHKRNHRTWVKKLVIALVVLLIIFTRINLIPATGIHTLLSQFKITTSFIDLILIYCGWSFFQ